MLKMFFFPLDTKLNSSWCFFQYNRRETFKKKKNLKAAQKSIIELVVHYIVSSLNVCEKQNKPLKSNIF